MSESTKATQSGTIVFVHGLFMTPASWDAWGKYFEDLGYDCHAPAYPYHAGKPADLRKNPDPRLATLTFGEVTSQLATFIDSLPEKPILIGHSMGGLAVQKLLSMGKGLAGIAIDSAPPKGVTTLKWSFLKANFPTINPLKGNSICMPSLNWFRYAFLNNLGAEEAARVAEEVFVPESRNIPRSGTKQDGAIDFKKPHAPLLFVAGGNDNIIPASLNHKNFKAYQDQGSRRDYKEFAGRSHYICGENGWEEVAGFVAEWIGKNA